MRCRAQRQARRPRHPGAASSAQACENANDVVARGSDQVMNYPVVTA